MLLGLASFGIGHERARFCCAAWRDYRRARPDRAGHWIAEPRHTPPARPQAGAAEPHASHRL